MQAILRRPRTVLLVILLLGGALRLVGLTKVPPGLNQDEAANGWNAFCMLQTGKDQFGQDWPIFYTHGFGANRSTLYLYTLLPFQKVGGLNIWTTRLPCAVGGVLTLLLLYYVAARWFDRPTALLAALLLALNPWHIQMSRWGHEGGLTALLVIIPIAAMAWARLPFIESNKETPRPLRALLAGGLLGVCCYGYPAARLFIPAFFIAGALVTLPHWWKLPKLRRGLLSLVLFLSVFAITFGPLLWKHLTDPAINKRGETTWIWQPDDPAMTRVGKVLTNYRLHFSLHFLFLRGDYAIDQSPPGQGQLHWYVLPFLLVGIAVAIRHYRSSIPARLLLVWLLLYPLGDCFNRHAPGNAAISLHAMRSLPGAGAFMLLAGLGIVASAKWFYLHFREYARLALFTTLAIVLCINGFYLKNFFCDYPRQSRIYDLFHSDLVQACQWLQPRLDEYDAVICTTSDLNQPYMITLVTLGYDPQRWFNEPRYYFQRGHWDYCSRYGKMYFMYPGHPPKGLEELKNNGREDNVLYVLRPWEVAKSAEPFKQIHRPNGTVALSLVRGKL